MAVTPRRVHWCMPSFPPRKAMCSSLSLSGNAPGDKGPLWPQAPEARARQGRLGEGEARDWAMCLWFQLEAVRSLCLTLKIPKAKDSRLEGTETQGGRPKQFPHRLSAKEETWGQSHFCVFYWKQDSSSETQGRRQRAFWVSPSGPVRKGLSLHHDLRMLLNSTIRKTRKEVVSRGERQNRTPPSPTQTPLPSSSLFLTPPLALSRQ